MTEDTTNADLLQSIADVLDFADENGFVSEVDSSIGFELREGVPYLIHYGDEGAVLSYRKLTISLGPEEVPFCAYCPGESAHKFGCPVAGSQQVRLSVSRADLLEGHDAAPSAE